MADTKLPIDLLKLKFAAAKKRKVEENIYDIDPISDDEDGPGMYSVYKKIFVPIDCEMRNSIPGFSSRRSN